MDLDAFDLALLEAVQRNALATGAELAAAAHLSPSACMRRLQRLRAGGVIRREVAILDADAVGRPLTILVNIVLNAEAAGALESFAARLAGRPEILQLLYVTGEYDLVATLQLVDMAEYQRFIDTVLLADPLLKRFTSTVALKRLKQETALPLGAS